MTRQVTKASENRYCQARLDAARHNPDFLNRISACAHLPGVTEESLKKYELDINRPPNTVVALMADAYNSPELTEWYCANECPLGRNRIAEITSTSLETNSIKLHNTVRELDEIICEVFRMVEDGTIDNEEMPRLIEDRDKLVRIKHTLVSTVVAIDKHIAHCKKE